MYTFSISVGDKTVSGGVKLLGTPWEMTVNITDTTGRVLPAIKCDLCTPSDDGTYAISDVVVACIFPDSEIVCFKQSAEPTILTRDSVDCMLVASLMTDKRELTCGMLAIQASSADANNSVVYTGTARSDEDITGTLPSDPVMLEQRGTMSVTFGSTTAAVAVVKEKSAKRSGGAARRPGTRRRNRQLYN